MFVLPNADAQGWATNAWTTNAVRGQVAYWDGSAYATGRVSKARIRDCYEWAKEREDVHVDGWRSTNDWPQVYWFDWGRMSRYTLSVFKIYMDIYIWSEPNYVVTNKMTSGNFNYYFSTNSPAWGASLSGDIIYDSESLIDAAGVETNYFDYTPYRKLYNHPYGWPPFQDCANVLVMEYYFLNAVAVSNYVANPGGNNEFIWEGTSGTSWADAKSSVSLTSNINTNDIPCNISEGSYDDVAEEWTATRTIRFQYLDFPINSTNHNCKIQVYPWAYGGDGIFDANGSGLSDAADNEITMHVETNYTGEASFSVFLGQTTNNPTAWPGDPEGKPEDRSSNGWIMRTPFSLDNELSAHIFLDFSVSNGFDYVEE